VLPFWRKTRPSVESSTWVVAALRAYEARTFAQVAAVRSLVFAVLAAWVFANYGVATGLKNLGIFVAFVGIGLLSYALVRDRPERLGLVYLFAALDVILLAYTLLAPGRTYPASWPWQSVLRQPDFVYFLLLPALALPTFRPLLVAWTGLCVCLAWAAGTALLTSQPSGARVFQVSSKVWNPGIDLAAVVRIGPAATRLQRIPRGPRSRAR